MLITLGHVFCHSMGYLKSEEDEKPRLVRINGFENVLRPVADHPDKVVCQDHLRDGSCPSAMTPAEAQAHLQAMHMVSFGLIFCPLCGWTFKQFDRYFKHLWMHRLTSPCDRCKMYFRSHQERFEHFCERHGITAENS
ncbi:hypothetical protein BD413DRAFT_525169 [Trametes elegans]|nr:hypothetical protein BD413DRAFT_525169 [Trametes elegans]